MNCFDSTLWKEAMKDEMDSLLESKTRILVDKPKN